MTFRRGFSLIEIVVVVAIAGYIAALSGYLLFRPKQLVEDVSERLTEDAVVSIQSAKLVERFSRSFVMRRGFLTCTSPLQRLLESTAAFPNANFSGEVNEVNDFTLVSSNYSALVAVSSLTGEFSVTEINKFPRGAIVLLSSLNDPTLGGLYQVTEAVATSSRVRLSTTAPVLPQEFGCQIRSSMGLSQFLRDPRNQVFGRMGTTYRADVIQFARYFTAQRGTSLLLRERLWPVPRLVPDMVQENVTMTSFANLRIESGEWRPSGNAPSPNGVFFATLAVAYDERSMTGTGLIRTDVRRRISYSTLPGGTLNFGAVAPPESVEVRFPACAVYLAPATDMFVRSDEKYGRFFRVYGLASDAGGKAGFVITMDGPPGQDPICWHESNMERVATVEGVKLQAPVNQGVKRSIGLNPAGTGYQPLICDVPASASFNGLMLYFHPDVKKLVRIPCSGAQIPDKNEEYVCKSGTESKCYRTGEIGFCTLVRKNVSPEERGPTLFVDDSSCEWQSGKGLEDCRPNGRRGDLQKVILKPKDIPGDFPRTLSCTSGFGGGGD